MMAFWSDLLGPLREKTPAAKIRETEKRLRSLAEQRAAAAEAITAANARRDGLLLRDESDPEIDDLEKEIDRSHRLIERCDAAEPKLLQQLEGLRDEERARQWRALVDHHDKAARTYLDRAEALLDALDELREVFGDAEPFAERVHRMIRPPHPHAIDRPTFARLSAEFDRMAAEVG